MAELLRLALVSDIHAGRGSLTKRGAEAIPLLEQFCAFVDSDDRDVVVELGDRITDTDPGQDIECEQAVAECFASLLTPRRHIMGNHDAVHLSREANEEVFGQSFASSSFEMKGWHLVLWQAGVDLHAGRPMLSTEDLAWLEADLAAANQPAIVFSHIPLDAASMTGNYYFQANPEYATYSNAVAARELICGSGKVAACIAGHVHWNNVSRIDGVPFISIQSLTESYTTQGEACGSWSTMELGGELHWRGHGADPIVLTVELGGADRKWVEPLPSFAELARMRREKAQTE